MTKGIVLLAYGKHEYIYMAAHMIASIKKYSPELNITILHDSYIKYLPQHYLPMIDKLVPMDDQHLYTNGSIDPGKAKCSLTHYLPYDVSLFLDVDGLCLKDLTPLFDVDKDFAIEVMGEGGKNDKINHDHWATNENVWDFFKLKDDQVFRTVQGSAMLFKKGAFINKLQKKLDKGLDYPVSRLKSFWGKNLLPDELIYAGALAQLEYDPSFPEKVSLFGHTFTTVGFAELQSSYYVLSMFGGDGPFSATKLMYKDWYDRLNSNIHREIGASKIKQISRLLKGKTTIGK